MSFALEEPKQPQQPALQQAKLYKEGCGEGLLMCWCFIIIATSIIAGFYVSTITTIVPSRSGLFTEEVPLYGPAGGFGFALGGLCFAALFYGLARAIALLKLIATRLDGTRVPLTLSQPVPDRVGAYLSLAE